MNLHKTPEFRDVLVETARNLGLPEQFVEKDYYVTEILRIVATTHPGKTIFKGGTSLMKGWRILDRYSEDIDLFVDPEAWDPVLGKRGVDRELKRLRDAVAIHPALAYERDRSRTIGGFGREDYFSYESVVPDPLLGLETAILLEPGVQSGRQPTEAVEISSMASDYLRSQGAANLATDLEPFPMVLLHFRRTFVEKLFTVHSKVERLKQEGHGLGRNARHYADLHALAARPEVEAMLRSDEYEEIKVDYDERSRRFFPKSYRPPPNLSFADSDALFPPDELRAQIEDDYERECGRLFPGNHPSFDEVIARLEGLRQIL